MDWRNRKYYIAKVPAGERREKEIGTLKNIGGVKLHPYKRVRKQNDEQNWRIKYDLLVSVPFHGTAQVEKTLENITKGNWEEILRTPDAKPVSAQLPAEFDFFSAWNFLRHHAMFKEPKYGESALMSCLYMDVVKVDPSNYCIDCLDKSKNTLTQVWLECGPYSADGVFMHDIDLDCGSETFEGAIIKLATLVKQYYNSDGTKK